MRVSTIAILLLITFILMLSCSTDSTPVYQLKTSADPLEAGEVTPSEGEFEKGEQVEITATPNEHWVFDRWSGDHSGTGNRTYIIMDSDKNVTALFEKRDYPLTITIEGEGEVEQEIIQPKTTEYPHGTVVKLTAIPESGWAFIGWSGDVESTQNPFELTVSEETNITAVFEVITYPLTVETIGEGNVQQKIVQAKTTDYDYGTVVELTAVAEQQWVFLNWSADVTGSENPVTITIDDPKHVTAEFERSFTLSTVVQPEGAGSISPSEGEYVRDTTFNVEAVANYGWVFKHWEGDFSGSINPFSLTMNGNKTITAHFEREEFVLETEVEGEGEIEIELISGTQTENGFLFESVVRLRALPDENWNFMEWKGDATGTNETIDITIDDHVNITAVFSEFAGGDGSSANPFQVGNLYQLQRVGSYLDKHFIQIADIDASETKNWGDVQTDDEGGFEPIGNDNERFTGAYDGNEFKISNLFIWRKAGFQTLGLFGYVEGGTIKNINLSISFDGYSGGGGTIGGLVAINEGIIENVVVTGGGVLHLKDETFTGGIVGLNFGTIKYAKSSAFISSVEGRGGAGGIAGKNEGTIRESSSYGDIHPHPYVYQTIGGLVGINTGSIIRSYSTSNYEGDGGGLGGLVGVNTENGEILESYASGDIYARCVAGGLVGINEGNAIIENSYATGDVDTHNILCGGGTGGLVGENRDNAEIRTSFSHGNVTGGVDGYVTSVGGLVGINNSQIIEAYATGVVTGESYDDIPLHKGGLIGSQGENSVVERSYWDVQASQINDGIGDGEGSANEIEGLQTSQMQGTSARDNMPEFDWDNIWRTITSGYPILWWQVE